MRPESVTTSNNYCRAKISIEYVFLVDYTMRREWGWQKRWERRDKWPKNNVEVTAQPHPTARDSHHPHGVEGGGTHTTPQSFSYHPERNGPF